MSELSDQVVELLVDHREIDNDDTQIVDLSKFKEKSLADEFEKFAEELGGDLADAVLDEVEKNPAFDKLDADDRELVVYVVRRKASVLRSIEVFKKTNNHKMISVAKKSIADLKSIEAGLVLIGQLRILEIMKAKAKALALDAVGFALRMAL